MFLTGLTEPQAQRPRRAAWPVRIRIGGWAALALSVTLISQAILAQESGAADRLVVYSGRAERLIKPVLDTFTAKTNIKIDLLSSKTTGLVNRLQAENKRTSADLFVTNDAGSLERARELGILRPVNLEIVERTIPWQFRASDNSCPRRS